MLKFLFIATVCLIISVSTNAQQQPQPNTLQYSCVDANSLPVDLAENHIMFDNDNDKWILLTIVNSGKQILGFVPKRSTKFCVVAEGKIAPKS